MNDKFKLMQHLQEELISHVQLRSSYSPFTLDVASDDVDSESVSDSASSSSSSLPSSAVSSVSSALSSFSVSSVLSSFR